MGRAEIISGGTDGHYAIQLTYARERFTAAVAALNDQIAVLATHIATLGAGTEKTLAELRKTALELRVAYMNDNMPSDLALTAWCADLTTDLTGTVGTIEVPGERGTVLIQPGFNNNAVFDSERDGQLFPSLDQTPEGLYYNLALLPGWQKWMPTYRFGTISNLAGDTCDVTLEAAISSQQDLNVNQGSVLIGVSIDYMASGGAAFSNGDEVVVKFIDQDWQQPLVIGFKSHSVSGSLPGSVEIDSPGRLVSVPDSPDWAFGTNLFTIDFWFRKTSVFGPGLSNVFEQKNGADFWEIEVAVDGTSLASSMKIGGTFRYNLSGVVSISVDTFYHIALIRGWAGNPNTFALTFNGALVDSQVVDPGTEIGDLASVLKIGDSSTGGLSVIFDGFVDEFRISDVTRWTSAFTPDSSPYSVDVNTLLLMHMDGLNGSTLFPDSSGNHSPTSVNSAAVNTAIKKF